MEVRPPRQQLHGYVSTEARDGWYDFAQSHGTNVTALLEATVHCGDRFTNINR